MHRHTLCIHRYSAFGSFALRRRAVPFWLFFESLLCRKLQRRRERDSQSNLLGFHLATILGGGSVGVLLAYISSPWRNCVARLPGPSFPSRWKLLSCVRNVTNNIKTWLLPLSFWCCWLQPQPSLSPLRLPLFCVCHVATSLMQ